MMSDSFIQRLCILQICPRWLMWKKKQTRQKQADHDSAVFHELAPDSAGCGRYQASHWKSDGATSQAASVHGSTVHGAVWEDDSAILFKVTEDIMWTE